MFHPEPKSKYMAHVERLYFSDCWLATQFPEEGLRFRSKRQVQAKTASVSECLLNLFPPGVMPF